MNTDSETEGGLLQQQLMFSEQLQAERTETQANEEPFSVLEARYNQAAGIMFSLMRKGGVPREEQEVFDLLQEQYETRKEMERELEQSKFENSKRTMRSSSPLFEPQVNAPIGSKRKLDMISESFKPPGEDKDIIEILQRLAAEAPEGRKMHSLEDGARVLRATRQLPSGSVKYAGNGLWSLEGMTTALKHHQLINVGWMQSQETRAEGPKGGMLADEMGLGKTLSALANMVQAKRKLGKNKSKTNLVLVPKSLLDQWNNEAREHTVRSTSENGCGLGHIHAYNTHSSVSIEMQEMKQADLVIATYSQLCRGFKNFLYPKDLSDAEKETYFNKNYRSELSALYQIKFRAIYLDEGHDIRNPKALRSMACQRLKSNYRWVLTGTPMTNNPADLYAVLTFFRHPIVSKLTLQEFKANYKGPSRNEINEKWVSGILYSSMSRWLHSHKLFGRPLVELPEPIIIDLCRELSAPERAIYSVLNERLKTLATVKMKDPDSTKTYQFISSLLMVLRQMTGHVLLIRPAIFRYLTDADMDMISDAMFNGGSAAKPTQLSTDESLGQEPAELPEPNLNVYAQDYMAALRKLQRSTTCVMCKQRSQDIHWAACYHAYCSTCLEHRVYHAAKHGLNSPYCVPCNRSMGQLTQEDEDMEDESPRWLNESGKVIPSTKSSAVIEFIKSWRHSRTGDPGAKIVVFTGFKESHKFLAATFEEKQWGFNVLTSDMSSPQREASVKNFTKSPDAMIMLAMSGVGGQGLNLMAAKYLINYDQYFNDSTEKQACGRIYRIGQKEQTTMVSITAIETVDEHVRDIKLKKARNINKIILETKRKSTKALTKMFEKSKEVKELAGSDWEDEVELEDW